MARAEIRSLRPGRLGASPLAAALLVSLLLHLGGWAGYETGKKFGWWKKLSEISLVKKSLKKNPAALLAKKDAEPPLIFVDVSRADAEPPKKAKYYSNKNSQAANPDPGEDPSRPKLNGSQTEIPKAEDAPKLQQLQPATPPQPPTPETKPQEQAEKSDPLSLGDHELKKISAPAQPPPQPERPRTLAQARAQQLPGKQMQQSGGVQRLKLIPAFDTKATAFGEYDAAMFQAIQVFWQHELDQNQYAQDCKGRVAIKFILHYDGSISDLQVLGNEVGTLFGSYCQEAIEETAPYAKWPDDMLHLIGSTQRPITITFIYE